MSHLSSQFLGMSAPIPIAHRGGMAEGYKNTIDAIRKSLALGFIVETDVSVTADDVAILWHPRGADRMRARRATDVSATGPRLTDLCSDRVNGEPAIYRLDEVLDGFPDLHALIDVKKWPAIEPTAQAVARTKSEGRVSIGTFSQPRTDATARRIYELTGREVPTAMGLMEVVHLGIRALLGPDRPWHSSRKAAQVPARLATPRFIKSAHHAGINVFPWTVNDEPDMKKLLSGGVDGIMTDYPTRLRRVLDRRFDSGT